MARLQDLDFRKFIEDRMGARAFDGEAPSDGTDASAPGARTTRGLDYAYGSDKVTRATFDSLKPVEAAAQAAVRAFKHVGKAQLLGSAVKVGPRQFPRVEALARECAETLGIAPPVVYIVNSAVTNAATYGTNDDAFILVHSRLVDHFSEAELRGIIGHECGHIHNSHVVYLTAMHYLATAAGLFLRAISVPASVALRAWSRRAEITCDRAGALCTKDTAVLERALAKLALGSAKLYDQLDVEAFLEQHAEGQETPGRFLELFASHPFLPKRIMALREFGKSQLYRRYVGLGGDGLSMSEVDARVRDLVQLI